MRYLSSTCDMCFKMHMTTGRSALILMTGKLLVRSSFSLRSLSLPSLFPSSLICAINLSRNSCEKIATMYKKQSYLYRNTPQEILRTLTSSCFHYHHQFTISFQYKKYIIKIHYIHFNWAHLTSMIELWKSSLLTPWRSNRCNIGLRDGRRIPFST